MIDFIIIGQVKPFFHSSKSRWAGEKNGKVSLEKSQKSTRSRTRGCGNPKSLAICRETYLNELQDEPFNVGELLIVNVEGPVRAYIIRQMKSIIRFSHLD